VRFRIKVLNFNCIINSTIFQKSCQG